MMNNVRASTLDRRESPRAPGNQDFPQDPLSDTVSGLYLIHRDLMKISKIFDFQTILRNLFFDFASPLGVAELFVIARNVLSRVMPEEIRSLGLARSPEWVGAR